MKEDEFRERLASMSDEELALMVGPPPKFVATHLEMAREEQKRRAKVLEGAPRDAEAGSAAISAGAQLEANDLVKVAIVVSVIATVIAFWALIRTF